MKNCPGGGANNARALAPTSLYAGDAIGRQASEAVSKVHRPLSRLTKRQAAGLVFHPTVPDFMRGSTPMSNLYPRPLPTATTQHGAPVQRAWLAALAECRAGDLRPGRLNKQKHQTKYASRQRGKRKRKSRGSVEKENAQGGFRTTLR